MSKQIRVYIFSYLAFMMFYVVFDFDILKIINNYLNYALIIPTYFKIYEIIFMPFLLGFIINLLHNKKYLSNEMKNLFSLNYAFILFFCLFSREPLEYRAFNFDLYSVAREIPLSYDIYIFNVIMFIPLIFYKNMTFSKYLIFILLIEFIQYITRLGVFDLTDILFYLIAYLLGYLIKKVIITRRLDENKK